MTGYLDATVQVTRGSLRLDIAISVSAGQTLAIVGPNGSGKSTLLRALAGLTPINGGQITVDGVTVDGPIGGVWVPPERRRVGFVHQDYLLFEHLNVLDNVAFGPRCQGLSRAAAHSRARQELERVDLTHLADRRPVTLSGGQRQRVALARALATDPALLLLDEPLSALDASVASDLRGELTQHLRSFSGASLIVTHDPLDALLLGDRIAILEAGRIVQIGTSHEVAQRPASHYVAQLLGLQLLRGSAAGGRVELDAGGLLHIPDAQLKGAVVLSVRPAAVSFHRAKPDGTACNVWLARVASIVQLGDRVRVSVDGTPSLAGDVTPAAVAELRLAPGDDVWVSLKVTEIDAFPAPAAGAVTHATQTDVSASARTSPG